MSWWWGLVFSFVGVLVGGVMGVAIICILACRNVRGEDDG